MRAREKIRVLVLSGYRPLRVALRELFEHEGIDVVGEGSSAQEAVALAWALAPQVAVIDEQLPDGDARTVCRALGETGTHCVILGSLPPGSDSQTPHLSPVFVLRDIAGSDLPQAVRAASRRGAAALLARAAAGRPTPAEPVHRGILAMLDGLHAGGSQHLEVLVETWEPAVLSHRPSAQHTGVPCLECDEPWPCTLLRDIVQAIG